MKLLLKTYWLISPIILLICFFLFDVVLNVEFFFIRTLIAVAIAVFLSPRKKKIKTQTGEKTQITWIFLKEPIFLN